MQILKRAVVLINIHLNAYGTHYFRKTLKKHITYIKLIAIVYSVNKIQFELINTHAKCTFNFESG